MKEGGPAGGSTGGETGRGVSDGPAVDRKASIGTPLLPSRALFDPLTLIPRPLEEYF